MTDWIILMAPGQAVANEHGVARTFETRDAAMDYAGSRLESEGWLITKPGRKRSWLPDLDGEEE